MENTSHTAQTLTSYSNLENVIISGVSTITGVPMVDIMSNSKKKEVALAKAIVCTIFTEYGYGKREVGRLLNIDPKGIKIYVDTHPKRLEDRKYQIKYDKAKEFVESYEQSNEVSRNTLLSLRAEILELKSRYEHLKELLTSN